MQNNSTNNTQNENRFVNQVCTNTKSDLIEITEDKLENILLKYFIDFKKSRGWLTPLTIFITLLITVLTADFKDFLSISKTIWTAIFYISLFLSLLWSIYALIQGILNYKKTKLEKLLETIKNN